MVGSPQLPSSTIPLAQRRKKLLFNSSSRVMSQFPDYYRILNITKSATREEVRQAYRKESLKTHPDRFGKATPEVIKDSTQRFQLVADAYYVLSDPKRRKEYDNIYASRTDRTTNPDSSSSFFSGMFGANGSRREQPDAEGMFADAFDELLRPEINRRVPWWSWFGAVCGAGIGLIIGNIPGLMIGAFAGNRLGAIRDAKGKSVAAVFNDLGGPQKAEILRALALKVLGSAL